MKFKGLAGRDSTRYTQQAKSLKVYPATCKKINMKRAVTLKWSIDLIPEQADPWPGFCTYW